MKKQKIRLLSVLLAALLLLPSAFSVSAAQAAIQVDGAPFDGTLAQAIALAGQSGGTVGIFGKVTTHPIGTGEYNGTRIDNVTLQGMTSDAQIVLLPTFFDLNNSKFDVLTVTGSSVTIRDLTVDAGLKVDFPIRVMNGADGIILENVIARRGTRGAVNLLTSGCVGLTNVQANESIQGGFYFDACDCTNVSFVNCSTKGNLRTGVLVRNGYAALTNLDLSGVACHEGTFAVEDRMAGTISGGPWAEISILAAPKNAQGEAIRTDRAKLFHVEQAYQHIRYGVGDGNIASSAARITTVRYGFDSTIYYGSKSAAEADKRTGEAMSCIPFFTILSNYIQYLLAQAAALFR